MTHQELDRLISVMNANTIKYNRHFRDILERGFSDAAEESFFEEVVEEIETILRRGVNCGFSKGMREILRDLTSLAVKIGASGWRAVDLERLRQEKSNLMASLKMPKEDYMNFDLRNNMKEYLESTKSGMQVLLASAPAQTDAERANMDTCRAMIEEIGGLVEKTIDVVSPAAVEKYNDMMINLHKWRNNLARSGGLYDATTVELLRKVLNAARAWGSLYIASGRPAKISDVIAVPIDDLTRTVESEGVRQNVEMFLTRCEAYAQETAGMRNNGTHEQITLRREKLKTIAAREQEIVVQFRNGDLAREDAEYELQNLKDEKDFLNYEIERLEGDRVSREEVQLRRNMILKIERPIRTAYNHVRRNRLHVHAVFNGIDFARMIAMINNNVSASQLEAGVADLETLLLARGVIDKQGQVSLEGVTKITAEVDQLNEELLGTAPKTATPTDGEGSLLDQLLASTATPASGSTIPTGTTGDTHRTGRRTEDIID